MVSIVLDGKKIDVEEGTTILKVARDIGIDIPTLCYHEMIKPYNACRLCIVEVTSNGRTTITASCSTEVEDGMVVKTDSLSVINVRKMVAELLLARAPSVEKIREIAAKLGIEESRFVEEKEQRCILCGLCVRACEEIVGVNAISFINRGTEREVSTPFKVESDVCIGCGACEYFCPTEAIKIEDIKGRKVLHDYLYLGPTKAIRVPFLQAIPNVPVVDENYCIHFKTDNCKLCEKSCEPEAINHDMKDEYEEVDVGTAILTTGYELFDSLKIPEYGYGKYSNVINSLQFEHLCHASGPTGGKILLENGSEPQQIAIIHCVGSRDKNYKSYCSRVCCMYAMKFAHLVHEKINAHIYEFYIDMRSFGKGYEEFYNRMLSEGITFIRGKVAEVSDGALTSEEEGKLIVRCEDTLVGIVRRIPVDMVVLCPALVSRNDSEEVAKLFGLTLSADGFFREQHPKLGPISTDSDGIFIAGACQGPKDIPDSVAQGAGAAGGVLSLGDYYSVEPIYSVIDDKLCAGCKICISVCPYDAITFNEEENVSEIQEMLCKGCGACVAACPGGVARQNGFKDEQIFAEIEGVLI